MSPLSDAARGEIVDAMNEAGVRAWWWDLAACQSMDPEIFFPTRGDDLRTAKRVCAECPVRWQCLDYAIEHHERYGIWGGLSTRERRKVARLRRLRAQQVAA